MHRRLKEASTINIKFNSKVISGNIVDNDIKILHINENGNYVKYEFDVVINALYANYNKFCDWFNLKLRKFQFNLQELDIIELPTTKKLGITIQDGPFPSFLPIGNSNKYFLAHVETSQLIREISTGSIPLTQRLNYLESNWHEIKRSCEEYIPLLKNAKFETANKTNELLKFYRRKIENLVTEIRERNADKKSIKTAQTFISSELNNITQNISILTNDSNHIVSYRGKDALELAELRADEYSGTGKKDGYRKIANIIIANIIRAHNAARDAQAGAGNNAQAAPMGQPAQVGAGG